MKALSIRQPWAWLIVAGYKDIENRSWPTNFRGRVYIHASRKFDEVGLAALISGNMNISRSGKRFEREEFQGHRNLGLVFRSLARTGPPDERSDLLEKAVDKFRQAEEKAGTTDLFNVQFNIILLEVEAQPKGANWGLRRFITGKDVTND